MTLLTIYFYLKSYPTMHAVFRFDLYNNCRRCWAKTTENRDFNQYYYTHMPIDKVWIYWIYQLPCVCVFLCLYSYRFLRRGSS